MGHLQLRFGQAMPEDWKKERESKQRASWWFRGLRGATNLAMLYLGEPGRTPLLIANAQ